MSSNNKIGGGGKELDVFKEWYSKCFSMLLGIIIPMSRFITYVPCEIFANKRTSCLQRKCN
jgi:hypothetical protein